MKHFLRLAALLACLIAPSAADAAARFLVACTTACTWDNSSTTIWSTTSGGAPGSAAPVAADTVTLDANSCVGGVTCTITVNANLSISSLTMGACTASTTGCILDFSANNNNITLALSGTAVSLTGSGTRTLNMGNGTWTLSAFGAVWDNTTVTNETLNANSSTILYSATSTLIARSLIGGAGKTYATVTISSPSSFTNDAPFNISTSFTIGTFNPNGPLWMRLANASTLTITNAFTWTGTATSPFVLDGGTGGTATISSANNGTMAFAVPMGIIFSGGGTFTCTSCFNMGSNTGITITGPTGGGGGRIIGG